MSENAEATEKAVKKTTKKPAKKAAAKKAGARKPAAKKAAKKTVTKRAAKPAADKPATKRGRPAGKKTARKAGVRRGKKGAKQFAYLLLTPGEGGEQKASSINGPFSTEKDALDDASIMADENTTIVLFREAKRGKVQKSTKFVSGR